MSRVLVVFSALLVFAGVLSAQPMSGNYTAGGTSPDFATLQDAANAIKSHGVSGPVFINIRPGTYTRDGGASRLMTLDSVIAGSSITNRITLQPDVANGGNPSNTILQADFTPSTPPSSRILVLIGADHVTLRNLTFQDADSMDAPASSLLDVEGATFTKPTVDDLVVDGCTFLGSRFVAAGVQFGTDYGIGSNPSFGTGFLLSGVFTNNVFDRLLRFISVASVSHGGTFDVEGNTFRNGYTSFTGSGNPLGAAIELTCAHATVRDNDVLFSTGNEGIVVSQAVTALVERNIVRGTYHLHGMNINRGSSQGIVADSIIIVNNIVYCSAGASMFVQTVNTKLFHNTVFNSGGFGTSCIVLDGSNFTSINNIFINEGIRCYDQSNSTNIVSDYNLIFGGGELVVHAGISYSSIESYQAATHLDSNSSRKDVTFQIDSLGIHIEECEAQDRVFNGTPLPAVRFDYYGAARDTITPFVGAVEGVRLPYDMFADVYKYGLSGPAFSASVADLNGDGAPEIAVPDFANGRVLIFHNNGVNRSFTQNGVLFPGFAPGLVRFFDLDHDSHQDLIVAGEANAMRIYWGDGAGFFSGDITVNTTGHPSSIDTGTVSFVGLRTIVLTEDNGFLPDQSFLCYLINDNGRSIAEATVNAGDAVHGFHPDTINSVLGDFASLDLDGNGSQEVVALSIGFPPMVYFFVDTTAGNEPWGHHDSGFFGTGTYLGLTSSIATGDFDGDQRPDLLTTGASEDKCVVLHNQGNRIFVADTIATTGTRGLVAFDYENDGDLDFVTANRTLEDFGVTVFLNDGTGHFTERKNCHYPFASGNPLSITAADVDGDNKMDLVITTFDSLFVLYNFGGFNGTTKVEDPRSNEIPQAFTLFQNYPNPFNPSTRIEYSLPSQSFVTIKIYNILGQEIATLVDEEQASGNHSIEWNGKSACGFPVSSGVYFYRIEARQLGGQFEFANVKKMVLLK